MHYQASPLQEMILDYGAKHALQWMIWWNATPIATLRPI